MSDVALQNMKDNLNLLKGYELGQKKSEEMIKDLYDALQAMVDYCNAECGSKNYPGHQAYEALAKARGETQ